MKLNRWTILAIILLLSTLIGLAFRPWGDGPSGLQTVEDGSLSLTCPQSYTTDSGNYFTIECEVVDIAELGDSDEVSAYVWADPLGPLAELGRDLEEISPGEYILRANLRAARNGRADVEVNTHTYVLADVDTTMVAEPFIPRIRQLVRSTGLSVLIRVQHHLLFYTVFGLSLLLFISLLSISIGALMYRRISGLRAYVRPSPSQIIYFIASVLWATYYALLLLLLLFHIVDTSALDRVQASIPAQIIFIVTIPLFLLSFVILRLVQWLTFRNADPFVSTQRTPAGNPSDMEGRQPSAAPFIGAVATGFVLAPLALLIQWLAFL